MRVKFKFIENPKILNSYLVPITKCPHSMLWNGEEGKDLHVGTIGCEDCEHHGKLEMIDKMHGFVICNKGEK